MRILALSDLHSDESLLKRIPACVRRVKPDIILILGDITTRGPLSYAKEMLDALEKTGVRSYAIFGNMDQFEICALLEERGMNVHMKRVELEGGWNLAGFGGSGPTPFGTPTEFSEEQIMKGLSGLKIDARTMLATHSPPFGAEGLDEPRPGVLAGSKSIRKIIEERQPALNFCGHIHEREGEAKIGKTVVVKVGAAERGRAAVVEAGKSIKVAFTEV